MLTNIGPVALLLILIVGFMLYGPSKLPQIGKTVGETLKSFKSGVNSESVSEDNEKSEPSNIVRDETVKNDVK